MQQKYRRLKPWKTTIIWSVFTSSVRTLYPVQSLSGLLEILVEGKNVMNYRVSTVTARIKYKKKTLKGFLFPFCFLCRLALYLPLEETSSVCSHWAAEVQSRHHGAHQIPPHPHPQPSPCLFVFLVSDNECTQTSCLWQKELSRWRLYSETCQGICLGSKWSFEFFVQKPSELKWNFIGKLL